MTKLTNLCTAAVIFPLVGNINNISVQKSHKPRLIVVLLLFKKTNIIA